MNQSEMLGSLSRQQQIKDSVQFAFTDRPGFSCVGWAKRQVGPESGVSFEDVCRRQEQSDHGEDRIVDVYDQGAVFWTRERPEGQAKDCKIAEESNRNAIGCDPIQMSDGPAKVLPSWVISGIIKQIHQSPGTIQPQNDAEMPAQEPST